ncbi:TPA: phage tail spike protein [Streptococcus suis]
MIYLFDKDEKLIKIVRKSAVKTALQKYALTTERYVSDRLTVELKGLNADELEQVEYMAIQTMEDAHAFHYFYVAQKSSDELTTLIGVQSGIEELRKSPVFDKRPKNAFARDVITDLLAGTNWQARFVGETTPHSTNFYYTSIFDALKKVCEVWDLEMQFFVEMNGNRIGGRYIDFKRRIGEAVGKRVVYGHNALQILQEVERTNIFTALIGRGKGEETGDGYGRKITFEDVVWSRTQGKPVDKPKGQKYLELPLTTRQYGIKNADGSMRPKIGFVDFSEEENPEVLIERTYKALVDSARPQLTLKTSSVYLKGVKIGDTIRVVRHDKKLDYDTRIFEITFNRLNNQSSDIKLGDRIGESNEAKIQTIADKAVEQFVTNEFSNFVQNLPDYLPSADGFNNNWYGTEDPTVKYPGKVLINDIWYKPDTEHEGHKIMLRWTGEVWEEILRTYDSEALRDRIAEEVAKVNETMQAQSEEHDRQVADILSKTQTVEELANQAKTDAASAITQALLSKDEAIADARAQVATVSQALNTAKTDLQKLATYQETVDRKLTELTSNTRTLDGKIDAASAKVDTVAGQIRTELTRVEGKIPSDLGGRNYILKSDVYATSGSRYFDTSPEFIDYAYSGKYVTISLDIKGENLVPDSRGLSCIGCELRLNLSDGKVLYLQCQKIVSGTQPRERISVTRKIPEGVSVVSANKVNMYVQVGGTALAGRPKFELSSIPSDWSPAPEDINSELSSTKTLITQTAEGQTQLSNRLTTTQDKVSTAETKINQLIGDVSSKVSQTDYNTLTGRVSSAETAITQNANEISKRLTSTQVESAITGKGYQTKSDVDSNITGRGYITSSALQPYALATTVQNLVRETADSFSRTISETKALIPTEVGGRNYLLNSKTEISGGWGSKVISLSPELLDNLNKIKSVTISCDVEGTNVATKNSRKRFGLACSVEIDGKINYWEVWQAEDTIKKRISQTFTVPEGKTITKFYSPSLWIQADGNIKVSNPKLEFGVLPTDWSPAPEDYVTVTAFNTVTDTVNSHTRTLSEQGSSISQAVQTAQGLIARVENLSVGGRNYFLKSDFSISSGNKAIAIHPDFMKHAKGKKFVVSVEVEGKNVVFADRGRFGIATSGQRPGLTWRDWLEVWETGTGNIPKKRIYQVFSYIDDWVDFGANLYVQIGGEVIVGYPKLEIGTMPTDWSPAPEDGDQAIQAVSTQVSQLAGSWAVQNLTNSGTVLNQLNLNKDGSVKIDGKLVQITGTTYIQDGVISSAKIGSLDAGKITTGTLDAARIKASSIDGSKLVFDQAFFTGLTANEAYLKQLFAKNAFITQVQAVTLSANKISGGILSATNDAMQMDLNTGSVNFFTDSPAIRRSVANLPNQFVKFATATEANDNSFKVLSNGLKTAGRASVTSIGTNRANGEKVNDGAFTGINIYASGPATGTSVVDRIGIHSDVLIVSHSASEGQRGWVYENYNANNNDFALRPLMPRGLSNYSSYIGTETHPITRLYSDDVMLNGHRLKGILKDLANRVGKYDGWAASIS